MSKICWNAAIEFREEPVQEEKKQTVYEKLESQIEQLAERVEKLEQDAKNKEM